MCKNDTKCKYMFMFPLKNLARKGLICQCHTTHHLPVLCFLVHAACWWSDFRGIPPPPRWAGHTGHWRYSLNWTLQGTQRIFYVHVSWWCHKMETFSALLALCARNTLVTSEFLSRRPVTRRFEFFFYLCLNKRLSKQLRYQWFEMPSC